MSIELRYVSNGIDRSADGVVAVYNNNYSNDVDANDAEQMANWDEDVALLRSNKELSIECRKLIDDYDTLFLKIASLKVTQADYRWVFKPQNFNAVGLEAYLLDRFTNTQTAISLINPTIIYFSVSNNTNSTASNRFEIGYKPTSTLPVTINTIYATTNSKGVQLYWSTINELNILSFIVEKSIDGNNFFTIATKDAKKNSSQNNYSITDASTQSAKQLYRLKIIELNNNYSYSETISVATIRENSFTVYPNPITGNKITLQLSDMPKDNYTISLTNYAGQIAFTKPLNHTGGDVLLTLTLDHSIAQGNYILSVRNNEKTSYIKKIIKQ